MDDFVQVLVFLAIILFSILSGAGKKKRAQARPPVPRPQPRPAVPQPRPMETARSAPAEGQSELAEGLLDLLRGRVPLEVPAQPQEPPPPAEEEAVLEDLEPDMAASHQAFQETYVAAAPQPPASPHKSRYQLTPTTARDAVVWSEIFGKPKGMP